MPLLQFVSGSQRKALALANSLFFTPLSHNIDPSLPTSPQTPGLAGGFALGHIAEQVQKPAAPHWRDLVLQRLVLADRPH